MSLWTLDSNNSVIPKVPFIWLTITVSIGMIGSKKPTFVPVQPISFTVKRAVTFKLENKIFYLSATFCASSLHFRRISPQENWQTKNVLSNYLIRLLRVVFHFYLCSGFFQNNQKHLPILNNKKFIKNFWILVKVLGSFRPCTRKANLHAYFNFIGRWRMTARLSLMDSCRTVFSGQGISLPLHPQNKAAIEYNIMRLFNNRSFFCLSLFSTNQTIYFLKILHSFMFLANSRKLLIFSNLLSKIKDCSLSLSFGANLPSSIRHFIPKRR